MKRLYTLLAAVLIAGSACAQWARTVTPEQMGARIPVSVKPKVQKQHSPDRITIIMTTDYQYLDEQFNGSTSAYGWSMGDSGTIRYTCVTLDTIVDNLNLQGYPFPTIGTYTVDSIHISVGHTNSSGNDNRFIFKLVNLGSNNYPNTNDVVLWSDTVTTNTSLWGQTTWLQFAPINLAVDVTLQNTDRVGVFFFFEGEIGDTAGVLASWLPDGPCTTSDRSRDTYFSPPHSYHFYNIFNTWFPKPNGDDIYWDCNNNQQYDQGIDSESYLQDVDIWFDLTVVVCGTITAGFNISDATCGQADGSASANVNGGETPYTFLWDANAGNQTTQTASNLAFGSYDVTVTDNEGCTAVFTATVNNANAPVGTSTSTTPSCVGMNDGTIDLTVTGGQSPYTFLWDSGWTGEDNSGLSAGSYTVTITDNQGCNSIYTTTVSDPPALVMNSMSAVDENQNQSNGSATANPGGGTSPYTYQWNDGNSQTTQTAAGLPAGNYCCIVTDVNGCTVEDCVDVNVVGIEESVLNKAVSVYPNPNNGQFNIQFTNVASDDFKFEITNLIGQEVSAFQASFSGNYVRTIDLNGMDKGVYFLKISNSHGSMTEKIIIE